MTAERRSDPAVDGPSMNDSDRLLVVAGVDGSESGYRALGAATNLIKGRPGAIEVVFVAHIPAGMEMSADAQYEMSQGFDDAEREVSDAIRDRMQGVEQRWNFRRRDGMVAHELIAVADELHRDYGSDSNVVIVVGGAEHAYHHILGSVPVALVRHATYPILVMPLAAQSNP
jgi:nucleotide-binding universal stress UspA family protein